MQLLRIHLCALTVEEKNLLRFLHAPCEIIHILCDR